MKWKTRSKVLELCCFVWLQNSNMRRLINIFVLELCCFVWLQNAATCSFIGSCVLELCCFVWLQNQRASVNVNAGVLELCCFVWLQNNWPCLITLNEVLELCCLALWFYKKDQGAFCVIIKNTVGLRSLASNTLIGTKKYIKLLKWLV